MNYQGAWSDQGRNLRVSKFVQLSVQHAVHRFHPGAFTLLEVIDHRRACQSFINRRGQAIGYTYNTAGQVTRQTFPDTTHTDFTYEAHGNLRTATDSSGVITFTYDPADRLTRLDYPNANGLVDAN